MITTWVLIIVTVVVLMSIAELFFMYRCSKLILRWHERVKENNQYTVQLTASIFSLISVDDKILDELENLNPSCSERIKLMKTILRERREQISSIM